MTLEIVETLHKLIANVARMLLKWDHLPLDRSPDFRSAVMSETDLTISIDQHIRTERNETKRGHQIITFFRIIA